MNLSDPHAATRLSAACFNVSRQVVNFHTVMGNYMYPLFGYREAA